jgi:hypothetical protein
MKSGRPQTLEQRRANIQRRIAAERLEMRAAATALARPLHMFERIRDKAMQMRTTARNARLGMRYWLLPAVPLALFALVRYRRPLAPALRTGLRLFALWRTAQDRGWGRSPFRGRFRP